MAVDKPATQAVAGFRPTTDIALIGRFTSVSRLWRTCDCRRFRRRIVAGRRRFNAQRETELNWTVQFSSVSRCALGFREAGKCIRCMNIPCSRWQRWIATQGGPKRAATFDSHIINSVPIDLYNFWHLSGTFRFEYIPSLSFHLCRMKWHHLPDEYYSVFFMVKASLLDIYGRNGMNKKLSYRKQVALSIT